MARGFAHPSDYSLSCTIALQRPPGSFFSLADAVGEWLDPLSLQGRDALLDALHFVAELLQVNTLVNT